jgi:hypothetical protein
VSRRPRPAILAILQASADLAPALLPLIAGCVVIAACAPLLGPVFYRAGDNAQHLLAEHALAETIRSGGNPFGPLGLEFGLPLLRFYQPLFHLWTASWHVATGLDLRALHLFTMVGCFALSPLSNCYFFGKIGLGRWTAGAASLLSVISVAGFGNSFEAYLSTGIATHAAGALFFPLFAGAFAGLVRGENNPLSVALLLSLSVVAHVTMAIYAMLYMVLHVRAALRLDGKRLVRLGVCGTLVVGLTAFWLLPFIEHTGRSRPVPDAVALGEGVSWWHDGVTRPELAGLLASGRLLDDARAVGRNRDRQDLLIDQLNLMETRRSRFPVVTMLAALGAFFAVIGFRRPGNRLLLAGFALALMLYAGIDDFPFLRVLPFVDRMQVFRSAYFVELFAFGLAGLGLVAPLKLLAVLGRSFTRTPARLGVCGVAAALTVLAVAGIVREAYTLGGLNLDRNAIVDPGETTRECPPLPRPGYPFRTVTRYDSFFRTEGGCLRPFGFEDHCSQWAGIGPTVGQRLCGSLRRDDAGEDLHELAGVRWFAGRAARKRHPTRGAPLPSRSFAKAVEPGALAEPPDLPADEYLLTTSQNSFGAALAGPVVAVIADDAEWLAIVSSWLAVHADAFSSARTPVPLRLEGASSRELPGGVHGLIVAPGGGKRAGNAAPGARVRGVPVVALEDPLEPGSMPVAWSGALWRRMEDSMTQRPMTQDRVAHGTATTALEGIPGPGSAYQSFSFAVESSAPLVLVLPMGAHPGWGATVDGRIANVFPTGPDFVGLLLPAGSHEVAFEWKMPFAHRLCTVVSLLSLLFVVLALLGKVRRPRRIH